MKYLSAQLKSVGELKNRGFIQALEKGSFCLACFHYPPSTMQFIYLSSFIFLSYDTIL